MMEKAQNESLMKENDRQKSAGLQNEFEILEVQDSHKNEGFKRSRTEILSDFWGEIEDNHKNESGFFTINSTKASSTKFVLINTKKTETLTPIFILPKVQTISLVRNSSICIFRNNVIQKSLDFSYLPMHSSKLSKNSFTKISENLSEQSTSSSPLYNQHSQPNLIEAQSYLRLDNAKQAPPLFTISKFNFNFISKRISLDTIKLDDIIITKVNIFTFDDAASVESIETDASRTHKMSVIGARDPIKEFFIFVSHK